MNIFKKAFQKTIWILIPLAALSFTGLLIVLLSDGYSNMFLNYNLKEYLIVIYYAFLLPIISFFIASVSLYSLL